MSDKLPTIFIGHGSPMNAIQDNDYTKALATLGHSLPKPKAILMVSAHWMTAGTWVTHMSAPKTIHDFHGFPPELFDVQYPAAGEPQLAESIHKMIDDPPIYLDESSWGLDHGTWAVLKHLYPAADIPVVQLSLDMTQPPEFHFAMGKRLRALREQDVLVLGSGNIVHNLRKLTWSNPEKVHEWAQAFDTQVKKQLLTRDYQPLLGAILQSENGRLSVPTPDHYYPLLYILGASDDHESLNFVYEGMELGAISMRTLIFGQHQKHN
ncbi:MAG: 4,5-DOPA dioxygenase extradiol [Bdellovibrionales bacterium]